MQIFAPLPQIILHERLSGFEVRLIGPSDIATLHAETVIPCWVWNHPQFRYVGIEIYLPESKEGQERAVALVRVLVERLYGQGQLILPLTARTHIWDWR